MITKERLKELIEQKATIYQIIREPLKIEKILLGYDEIGTTSEDLYETKEEAEECLEFGNIVREERLELPSWEEFLKLPLWDDKNNVEFKTNKGNTISIFKTEQNEIIVLKDIKTLFEKPLTKENYLEACELCRKLFLGEEV